MSWFLRLTGAAASAAGLAVCGLVPATAAPAQHYTYVESFDGTEHLAADENECGPWAASFHEVRSGAYKILVAASGQVPGEYHINGAVDGYVEFVPDDPSLPTYTGSYREKANAVITGYDEETGDDTVRVSRYALRTVLTGSDGSRLVHVSSGKVTFAADGTAVLHRESTTCE